MQKITPATFFTNNKILLAAKAVLNSIKKSNVKIREEVAFLYEEAEPLTTLNFTETTPEKFSFAYKIQQLKNKLNQMKLQAIPRMSLKKLWISASVPAFAIAAVAFLVFPTKILPNVQGKYSIYASTPLVLGAADYQIYSKDSRAQRINEVFAQYKCPIEGLGEVFVYQADKHNIPWWIVAAISFQESSCGKMTPEKKGVESYNAWGWAVYGDKVQMFDDWSHGIETVSEYLENRFFSRGITEPCDIMKVYTPPSKGSWCEGVKYFGDIIVNYKTPNE